MRTVCWGKKLTSWKMSPMLWLTDSYRVKWTGLRWMRQHLSWRGSSRPSGSMTSTPTTSSRRLSKSETSVYLDLAMINVLFYRIEKLESLQNCENGGRGAADLDQKEEIIKCLQAELVKVRDFVSNLYSRLSAELHFGKVKFGLRKLGRVVL